MSRARELQAATKAGGTVRRIHVWLTVPQAQALVEAGEEWPDFADMSGTQLRSSKRGAKALRSELLAIGREPTWGKSWK